MKIPRKLKKELKKQVLKKIDSNWNSKELRIDGTENNSRYKHLRPTYRGKTVTSYRLG